MSEWSPGIQRVLDHVARTRGWRLSLGCIRRQIRAGSACPISSMGRRRSAYWRLVARAHGLSPNASSDVAVASDHSVLTPEQAPIRAALLKAARLA